MKYSEILNKTASFVSQALEWKYPGSIVDTVSSNNDDLAKFRPNSIANLASSVRNVSIMVTPRPLNGKPPNARTDILRLVKASENGRLGQLELQV